MNAGSAGAFRPTLRALEPKLPASIPERIRILRELEFDLEELSRRLCTEGLTAEEARERAVVALVPDAATLLELNRLHAPRYAQLTRGLGDHRLRRLERTALAASTGTVVLTAGWGLARADLLVAASPFLWPVLGLGALLFAGVSIKVFELWIRTDHSAPARGLGAILGLSGATLLLGIGGVLIDLARLAAFLERNPASAPELALAWMVQGSALLATAMVVALFGGLSWFVIRQWVASVSGARRDVLGPGPGARQSETGGNR